MKFLTIIAVLAFVAFSLTAFTGFYPVALVNGVPILQLTWEKAEKSAARFLNVQAERLGEAAIDFSKPENREILLDIRKDTLTYLIEDRVLQDTGKGLVSGFQALAQNYAEEALGRSGDLERGIEELYGLSLGDFKRLVLLPQARRDLAREKLEESEKDFESWLAGAKRRANIRLTFVPFNWDGERVR